LVLSCIFILSPGLMIVRSFSAEQYFNTYSSQNPLIK
jgi:hypothetical protein